MDTEGDITRGSPSRRAVVDNGTLQEGSTPFVTSSSARWPRPPGAVGRRVWRDQPAAEETSGVTCCVPEVGCGARLVVGLDDHPGRPGRCPGVRPADHRTTAAHPIDARI